MCSFKLFIAGYGLSSEQKQLQSEAIKFARQEMAPNMIQWDEKVHKSEERVCCRVIAYSALYSSQTLFHSRKERGWPIEFEACPSQISISLLLHVVPQYVMEC